MRYIISRVDYKNRCFYVEIEGKLEAFHLTNRLAKLFLAYLDNRTLVEFSITSKRRKYLGRYMYQVDHFEYIASLKPFFVIYDLRSLRKQMRQTLSGFDHFLFLDCEMTMPGYGQNSFSPEIIQVGYLLSNNQNEILLEDSYFIKPLKESSINKRTKKFLHLDDKQFFAKAISYQDFYLRLSNIITKYNPKIVVWGKNDVAAIQSGYQIHHVMPLTSDKSFIDLLKLHKDYFNLKDDIGLFKAYQSYYGPLYDRQMHDAKTDAIITKDIFDAFIFQMEKSAND